MRVRAWGCQWAETTMVHLKCPNCDALYQVVKAEAERETINGDIKCRICGGPLAARDGKFVLKYFLLRKATRRQRWARVGPFPPNSDPPATTHGGWRRTSPSCRSYGGGAEADSRACSKLFCLLG